MPYKKRSDYNNYMQNYMKRWRKEQAQQIKQMRKALGIPQPKRGRKKK